MCMRRLKGAPHAESSRAPAAFAAALRLRALFARRRPGPAPLSSRTMIATGGAGAVRLPVVCTGGRHRGDLNRSGALLRRRIKIALGGVFSIEY